MSGLAPLPEYAVDAIRNKEANDAGDQTEELDEASE